MRGFCNLSGSNLPMVDPILPFLRKSYEFFVSQHCCGGLLLCTCWKSLISEADEYNLVVCNPATENWTELPHYPIGSPYEAVHYLGFDPAMPSHFVVFTHLLKLEEMAIYSSDTGRWTTVQTGWTSQHYPIGPSNCVFLNGTLHLMTFDHSIATVDTKGKVWREIEVPGNMARRRAGPSIGQSQGRLYAWYTDNPKVCRLSVWALEEYASAKWTFKHTVNILELFGRHTRSQGESYRMIAIHPDCNLIFLTNGKEKTISYDMDNQGVHVICTSKELRDAQPYVPCFAE
uniref:Uncharacterized protein n=1 Tax=Avena sativa TaxID=4498 RepID=A0ACD5TXD1_AVESA